MRALIVLDNLNTGGIASSLYGFLEYASQKLECALLIFDEESIDISKLPQGIEILKTPKLLHILGKSQKKVFKEAKSLALLRGCLVILSKFFNGELARRLIWIFIPKVKGFDVAISYAHDDAWKSLSKGCNDYVVKRVVAKYKASWVHCDYKHFGGYNKKQVRCFSAFDNIVCVSNSCKERFSECFPELKERIITCENMIDIEKISELSEPKHKFPNGVINFISVCRLSKVKGLSRTINAFGDLKKEGYDNYTWTIVGDGPEYASLKEKINSLKLNDRIKLIGNKENPYPFIAGATCFILPSFHEAAPMVFSESMALNIPIITTRTCSAIELVENKNIGIVVENEEVAIKKVLRKTLAGEIDFRDFSFEPTEVNKIAEISFNEFISMISRTLQKV